MFPSIIVIENWTITSTSFVLSLLAIEFTVVRLSSSAKTLPRLKKRMVSSFKKGIFRGLISPKKGCLHRDIFLQASSLVH